MPKSKKQKERAAAANLSGGGKSRQASAPKAETEWQMAYRPLSVEEFAKRAAALRRELRSSVNTTEIIRAHRDGISLACGRGDSQADSAEESDFKWPLADRTLSWEEFAERAAALRRELRSSIDSTEIIRACRDGKSTS